MREKEPYTYRIVRPSDGAVRWLRAHGEAVFACTPDGGERAIRYVGTVQDITEAQRAEDALRQSEARLRLAIEALPRFRCRQSGGRAMIPLRKKAVLARLFDRCWSAIRTACKIENGEGHQCLALVHWA